MANGLMIKLPVAATDNTLPKLPVALNSGSLVLIDNNKDMVDIDGFKALVDAASTGNPSLPLINRAADNAAALGISDASISVVCSASNKLLLSETTAKGGLHIAHNSVSTVGTGSRIAMSAGITSYLSNNRDHNIFAAVWARITRIGEARLQYLLNLGFNANNNFATINLSSTTTIGRGDIGVERVGNSETLGLIKAIAAGPFNQRNAEQSAAIGALLMSWFQSNVVGATGDGLILYRLYVEDLTVSGRTYEQAKFDDDAFYSSAITGRLAGDTWTNPI
ncbi:MULTISPECIES: hypothetical protein [Olivibacter]|uniref:Uncharacterized protein n=1 Tax=Olivibacter jilunii TaxID=985016 RepID=A0ABW6AZ70_9SPHI